MGIFDCGCQRIECQYFQSSGIRKVRHFQNIQGSSNGHRAVWHSARTAPFPKTPWNRKPQGSSPLRRLCGRKLWVTTKVQPGLGPPNPPAPAEPTPKPTAPECSGGQSARRPLGYGWPLGRVKPKPKPGEASPRHLGGRHTHCALPFTVGCY